MYHLDEIRLQYKNGGDNPKPKNKKNTPTQVTAFQSENYPEAAAALNSYFTLYPVPKIAPETAAKVARVETSMNPYAGTTFAGYGQVSQDQYARYYGPDSAAVVMNEYRTKRRSLTNAAADFNNHLAYMSSRVPADTLTFGRVMVNQFAPNSGLSSQVSKRVWDNNVKPMITDGRLPSYLRYGSTTYQDLMTAFDSDFYENGLDRPKSKKNK